MVAFAGVGASIKAGSNTFTNGSKWTCSVKTDTKDVTPIGAAGAWAVYLGTVNRWTAKITGWLDNSDAAQATLLATAGQSIVIELHTDGTHKLTGTAILNSIDPSVDAQSPESVDFSFQGSGAIAYT